MKEEEVQERNIVLEVGAQCYLYGAPEQLIAAIRSALTIDNPKYLDARRYSRWVGKKVRPKLYFYRKEAGRFCFPRGYANKAVLQCRSLTGCSPDIVDRRRQLPAEYFKFHGELRAYQYKAVEAILAHSFGVLEAGTGSGKTVMALSAIARRRQPALILVHSRELLYQWKERIEQFFQVQAGQLGDGVVEVRPVTVGIVNTVRKHLQTLPPKFGYVIVDECHRVPASLFTEVVSSFDSYFMLGLSATAFRREDGMTSLIYAYMGDRVHAVDADELIASGAVVIPELIQRSTGFHYGYRGEYARLIKALTKDQGRNKQITADTIELVRQGHEGTVLIVSDRVAHCDLLTEQLQKNGIQAALLTGQLSREKRAQLVHDVQQGNVEVLVATLQLIGEGFDCPGLSTLILATPIKFEGRLLQVVGRIMRPAAGKKAVVIDYVDDFVPVLRRSAENRRKLFGRWKTRSVISYTSKKASNT